MCVSLIDSADPCLRASQEHDEEQARLEPIYETHKGWLENTQGAKTWSELPALAIKYVRRVEELLGVQVSLLSTSPKREDTILVNDPFID